MSIDIRAFSEHDTQAVIALWRACELTRPWNNPEKDIERKLSVKDNLFLVAEDNTAIVGSVMGGYDGHRGWINYLAVAPSQRGLGLGKQLMQSVEIRLKNAGCPKINLQVRRGNHDAEQFYRAIGFDEDECISFGKRLIPDN